VLLAGGREHRTDDDATFYATAYGLFIVAAVAVGTGDCHRTLSPVTGPVR